MEIVMRKWGIGSEAVPTLGTAAVNVAAGASLDVGDCALTVGAISGGGTVRATSMVVAADAELVFAYRSPSDVDHITVDGPLAFAGDATARITVADASAVEPGEWPLLTATSGITGHDVTRLTLDSGFSSSKWVVRLFVRDGSIWLSVKPKGLVINFH